MSLVKAEKTENANRVKLEISVDAATFEKAVEAAYRKNVKKLNIPGFRRGKATRGYIEKMYGESFFYEDAMNDVYPTALDEAIAESGYAFVEDKMKAIEMGMNGHISKPIDLDDLYNVLDKVLYYNPTRV